MTLHARTLLGALCVQACIASVCVAQAKIESRTVNVPTAEEEVIRSWSALEQEFGQRDSWKYFSFEEFSEYRTFAEIVRKPNLGVFVEMMAQEKYPLVAVAGYCGIEKFYPDHAYVAAVNMILEYDRAMIATLGSAWDKVRSRPSPAQGREAMRILDTAASRRPVNASIIVGSLDREFLKTWFDESEHAEDNPTLLAVVVEVLICDRGARNPQRATKLKRHLTGLADIPGLPREIYVLHGDPSDPRFRSCVMQVLSDPDTSEIGILGTVRERGKFIKEHVDLRLLSLPEKRRDLVDRLLARYGSRDPSSAPSNPTTAPVGP